MTFSTQALFRLLTVASMIFAAGVMVFETHPTRVFWISQVVFFILAAVITMRRIAKWPLRLLELSCFLISGFVISAFLFFAASAIQLTSDSPSVAGGLAAVMGPVCLVIGATMFRLWVWAAHDQRIQRQTNDPQGHGE